MLKRLCDWARCSVYELFYKVCCPVCKAQTKIPGLCVNCKEYFEENILDDGIFILNDADNKSIKCGTCFSYEDERAFALLMYFKENRDENVLSYVSKCMCNTLNRMDVADNTVFVNVPRGTSNLKKFGFDQSREIAVLLAEFYKNNCKFVPVVKRKKKTNEQKKLNADERKLNTVNSMMLDEKYEKLCKNAKSIVVADDVITTGASILEAVRVLKNAYPDAKIYGISFASTYKKL